MCVKVPGARSRRIPDRPTGV